MKFNPFVILCFFIPAFAMAQKVVKPVVLVYGSDIEAFTAAVQSAKSSVPTVLVLDQEPLLSSLTTTATSIFSNKNLDGGIWLELLMNVAMHTSQNDSLAQAVKQDLNPQLVKNAIQKILSQHKNLTVIQSNPITSILKDKKGWFITLQRKQKYNVRVLVDMTEGGLLKAMLKGDDPYLKPGRILKTEEVALDLRRTTVAIGKVGENSYSILLQNILSNTKDNLFLSQPLIQVSRDPESVPFRASIGQAIGAAAAYCAFFKTTADKIDARKLQIELLTYQHRLLPFENISVNDPHYLAIQKIYLVGLVNGQMVDNAYVFNEHDSVKINAIKPVFNQLFSRSQLWFADHASEFLSWKDALSLIKFVGFKGDEIDQQITKDWAKKLKFKGQYDSSRNITQEEFAVLLDKYADPFVKAVSAEGKILR